MKTFDKYLILVLSILFVLVAAVLIGFEVRPGPLPVHPEATVNIGEVALPRNLPNTARAYYSAIADTTLPTVASAVTWGRGEIISGKNPKDSWLWLPFTWKLYLEPGRRFVWKAQLKWFGIPLVKGGDESVDGKGRFVMGSDVKDGPIFDNGEYTMLWLYTIFSTPTALLTDERIRWEAAEDTTVVGFSLEEGGKTSSFALHFDPITSELKLVETLRMNDEGAIVPYQAIFDRYESFDGIRLPTHCEGAWNGETYVRMDIDGVAYNVDIEEGFQRAEEAAEASTEAVESEAGDE